MNNKFGPLVSAEWLSDHLAAEDLRVIDLRWYLDGRSGRDAYQAGHVPGAVYVDLDRDITGAEGPGRHPLPSREQFQEAMRAAGVEPESGVVVYDDQGGYSAARLWWLLRYFGHQAVAVLDGGLVAWQGPLEREPVTPPRGSFHAAVPDPTMVVDSDYVRAARRALLIDARAPDRYRGEVEPIDPRAGAHPRRPQRPLAVQPGRRLAVPAPRRAAPQVRHRQGQGGDRLLRVGRERDRGPAGAGAGGLSGSQALRGFLERLVAAGPAGENRRQAVTRSGGTSPLTQSPAYPMRDG